MAIKWGCVEQIDAQRERPLYRGNGGVVIQLRVEIAQRRSSEPERRDLKSRLTKCTARHYGHRDHIGLSSGLWPAQSKTAISSVPSQFRRSRAGLRRLACRSAPHNGTQRKARDEAHPHWHAQAWSCPACRACATQTEVRPESCRLRRSYRQL